MTTLDKINQISSVRDAIKTALAARSVDNVTVPALFSNLADKILDIPGKSPIDPDVYVRPSEWLALPNVSSSERFVGLFAVYEKGTANRVAIKASGAFTVDWGDGNVQNFAAGVAAEHQFDYATVTGAVTSLGYKQVIVSVVPQAGNSITDFNLNVKHSAQTQSTVATNWMDIALRFPSATTMTVSGQFNARHNMLEQVSINAPQVNNATGMFFDCASLVNVSSLVLGNAITDVSSMFFGCSKLQVAPAIPGLSTTSVNMNNMFYGCYRLVSVPLYITTGAYDMGNMFYNCTQLVGVPRFDTKKVANFSAMFFNCYKLYYAPRFDTRAGIQFNQMFVSCRMLRSVPDYNTALATTMASMFSGCARLETAPNLSTGSVTTMASMFSGCYSLTSVPAYNTSNVTTMGSMFSSCYSLKTVPLMDTSKVTAVTNMFFGCNNLIEIPAFVFSSITAPANLSNWINGCINLRRVRITGLKISWTLSGCLLSATALNEVYTNLGTPGTTQTLVVTGNPGTSGDNPAIATAKKWTVTGT